MQIEELLANRQEIDAQLRERKSPVTVMFTDLVGSTAYFERFGDTAGLAWIEEHYQTVFPKIKEHGGIVVKTIGDAVMAYFEDSTRALAAAVAIQQTMQAGNKGRGRDKQSYIRIALHHGLAYVKGKDVFGDVVNVAARIAKTCRPAQILVSQAVYVNAGQQEAAEMRSVGESHFHGKSGTEHLYEVLWTDEDSYRALKELFPVQQKHAAAHEGAGEGRYIIINELGRGAMGVVYKAYDRVIGRTVAMKTMPVEVPEAQQAMLLARLKQEAQAAGKLDHPNIVTVYDVGDEAGLFYFTMQCVEGRTLASYRDAKELMPLEKVLEIADQICAAIGFAHSHGIIHRDIKPSNLMLTPQGALKVMDFGIAKLGDAGLTTAGAIVGTPSYLAPEQAAGRRVDHRADIFAIGAVLYELITCERAFPGESTTSIIYKILNEDPIPPRAIEPSLPQALDAVIRRALAKDPEKRYQNCEELRVALREARQGKAPKGTEAPATMLMKEEKSGKSWIGYVAAAVVVVGLGAGGYFWKTKWSAPTAQPAVTTQPVTKPAPAPPVQPAAQAPATTEPAKPEAEAAPPAAVPVKKKEEAKPVREREKRVASPKQEEKRESKEPAKGSESGMWTREEIPDLLAQADSYMKKGKYQSAVTAYKEVLRLDSGNQTAQDGLRRAESALGLRR